MLPEIFANVVFLHNKDPNDTPGNGLHVRTHHSPKILQDLIVNTGLLVLPVEHSGVDLLNPAFNLQGLLIDKPRE